MELLAKQVLDIISTNDWINIRARQGIRISGGGSEVVIDAQGIKGFTNGSHEMHASLHEAFGSHAASSNLHHEFPEISQLLTEKTWVEIGLVEGDKPVPDKRYILTDAGGKKHEGTLDANGFARVESIVAGHCKLEFPDIGQVSDISA
jgi:type VI secretion system secreted protein VgrG